MKTLQILYVYPQPYFGFPPWAVCAQLINHLDRNRFGAVVVAGEATEGEMGLADPDATPSARFPLATPAQLARSLPGIRRFALQHAVDVVHVTEDAWSMLAGVAVARVLGRPLVVHHHATPRMHRGARRTLLSLGASLAARNVGVSRFIANDLLDVGVQRTDWVLNGVDTSRFHPGVDGTAIRQEYGFAPEDIVVLQLGRFWRPKRQEDLLRGFALAHARAPRLRCLLVGWDDPRYLGPFGSYREELRQLSRDLGVEREVILAKSRPEAPQLHAAADIFGFPSIDDPCPLVGLEALASGKPVVGARSGGLVEYVTEGETGFLFSPGDPRELAERLVQLALDDALRARMGQAARAAAVHRHQLSALAIGFQAIYESVVGAGSGRPFGAPAPAKA